MIVLGVFRSAPAALDPGLKWMFLGDSQTAGRATGTTESHRTAFDRIWDTKYPSNSATLYQNGVSGRDLPSTVTHYNGRPERLDRTMVWVQESGNQNFTGQDTAAAFKTTLMDFWRSVNTNTPSALKIYETAFSFGREAEAFRNWDTYNTALREAKTELASEGITLRIIETDEAIKDLQALLTPGDVWFQAGDANEYHYKGLGNLMVAMAGFKAMNISLTLADLADIAEVNDTNKNHCLTVYGGLP